MKKYIILLSLSTLFFTCKTSKQVLETKANTSLEILAMPEGEETATQKEELLDNLYKEPHRPQFHFSPKASWMNDPNGMVFYEGEYHLFYQYYPEDIVWGPMHWGHAVSTDLVTWKHLPIALYPDKHGLIFSGSAVIDWNNSSGFGVAGKPPMVAIFSYHNMEMERAGKSDLYQTQGIAYSNDKGRSWTKYEGNPVIENPGIRDFRDPKVIWHAASEQWIMALATLNHLQIYASPNLKKWNLISDFGKAIGSHDGVWECPDIFPLPYKDGERWVLLQNMNPGNPNGGSGLQYFVGDFNGKDFVVDEAFNQLLARKEAPIPAGETLDDFENGLAMWKQEGETFIVKDGMLTSSANSTKGIIKSKPFEITKNAINFEIAGSNHRGQTLIALVIDGKRVREAEALNNTKPVWKGWNVANYKGKMAHIELIDQYTKENAYIAIKELRLADEKAYPVLEGSVWADQGRDNYAGVTWSDIPAEDGRRIFLGWMSNWAYAQNVPTERWRSAMTIPRTLALLEVDGIPRLAMEPAVELQQLRKKAINLKANETVSMPASSLMELDLYFTLGATATIEIILSNSLNEKTILGFERSTNQFYVDRTASGKIDFSADFAFKIFGKRLVDGDDFPLHLFFDVSSVELFADNGLTVFTELFFPNENYTQIEIKTSHADLQTANAWELRGIW